MVRHSAATNAFSSRSTSVKATEPAPCSRACSERVSSSAKNFNRCSGSFSAARIPPSAQVSNERTSRLSSTRPDFSSKRLTDSGAASAMRLTTRSHSAKFCALASRRAAIGAATSNASAVWSPASAANSGVSAASASNRLRAGGRRDRRRITDKSDGGVAADAGGNTAAGADPFIQQRGRQTGPRLAPYQFKRAGNLGLVGERCDQGLLLFGQACRHRP